MMKMASKFALVAAVAALAMAGSATDGFAAAKKAKKAAAPAACGAWTLKTATCNAGVCTMQRCWADGKWHPSLAMCWEPWCPK